MWFVQGAQAARALAPSPSMASAAPRCTPLPSLTASPRAQADVWGDTTHPRRYTYDTRRVELTRRVWFRGVCFQDQAIALDSGSEDEGAAAAAAGAAGAGAAEDAGKRRSGRTRGLGATIADKMKGLKGAHPSALSLSHPVGSPAAAERHQGFPLTH